MKIMKKLIENYLPNYSSEVLKVKVNGEEVRFKITSNNYNSGYEFYILMQTKNGDYTKLANGSDIPNLKYIEYHWNKDERIQIAKDNFVLAENYIKKVYRILTIYFLYD
jgi:hypothetical protein